MGRCRFVLVDVFGGDVTTGFGRDALPRDPAWHVSKSRSSFSVFRLLPRPLTPVRRVWHCSRLWIPTRPVSLPVANQDERCPVKWVGIFPVAIEEQINLCALQSFSFGYSMLCFSESGRIPPASKTTRALVGYLPEAGQDGSGSLLLR